PRRHLVADVLVLLLLDEPVAEVGDVELVPVEAGRGRAARQVRLDVVEQPGDLDGERLEGHLLAVAEAEIDAGLGPGRLRRQGLEAAPIADDLLEPGLAALAGPVLVDGLPP